MRQGQGKELILVKNNENETTVALNTNVNHQTAFTSIEIFCQGKVHAIAKDKLPFTVGRDLDKCDLTLEDQLISRQHFVLMLRDGLLVLNDVSTNGTWVQLGRTPSIKVKNNFLSLVGSGVIQPGSEIKEDNSCRLHFKVIHEEES